MALLDLKPVAATYSFGTGDSDLLATPPSLYYQFRLKAGESLTLTTGNTFDDLEAYLHVRPLAEQTDLGEVGTFDYFDPRDPRDATSYTRPKCFVLVTVAESDFLRLLTSAQLGHLPEEISLDVEGMTYDWQPDGHGKTWDNKTTPRLRIKAVHFAVPLFAIDSPSEKEDPGSSGVLPPTRIQIIELRRAVEELRKDLSARLLWLSCELLILAVALAVILKKWG